jgi:membrane protease YdiL (CAAX protease family)
MRAPVKSTVVTVNSKSWQMSRTIAAAIWAAVVLLTAITGIHLGYSGPRFWTALGVAAALFAFELFLAAPRVLSGVQAALGQHGGVLAVLVPLFAVLIYSLGVSGNWKYTLIGAAYAVVPALLLAGSASKPAGTWSDYAAVVLIWLPIEFRWMYGVFPFPPELTHTITVLMALSTGVAAFVLLRRLDGIGYAIEWKRGAGANVLLHFLVFIAIAIPAGIAMKFIAFDASMARLRSLPLAVVGITLFTAWPEEFLFRGVLQNLLSRTLNNQWAGLAVASVVFGLSHILHAPFPNWKYVILATIAGFFYGHAWMKSGSLLPGALIHALVDISWHLLFR